MDLTDSIVPKSDQLNADDLMAGPVTVTIESASPGSAEQPVNISLLEYPGRAYRPSKSMRRVMVIAWGADTKVYTGRRMTLFRNPEIMFAGVKVGGIEIAALSDIAEPLPIPLTTTRGKRKPFTVQPLTTRDWLHELELAGDDLDAVTALGTAAKGVTDPATLAAIRARYTELRG